MAKSYLITNAPKRPKLTRHLTTLSQKAATFAPLATVVVVGGAIGLLAEAAETNKYQS